MNSSLFLPRFLRIYSSIFSLFLSSVACSQEFNFNRTPSSYAWIVARIYDSSSFTFLTRLSWFEGYFFRWYSWKSIISSSSNTIHNCVRGKPKNKDNNWLIIIFGKKLKQTLITNIKDILINEQNERILNRIDCLSSFFFFIWLDEIVVSNYITLGEVDCVCNLLALRVCFPVYFTFSAFFVWPLVRLLEINFDRFD